MLSLTQSAKTIGRSKMTLMRDIKSGKLSACKNGKDWEIDPAELHRAYPSGPGPRTVSGTDQTEVLSMKVELLEEQLSDRNEVISDLRVRLDRSEQERRGVQTKLTALLTDRTEPKPWWKRLLG